MFGFRRKKKEKNPEDKVFDDLIRDTKSIDDMESPKKLEHMILDSCEQIIAETKDIEGKKAEYRILTKYLEDIRRIRDLNPKEASSIKKAAAAIERAQKSRKNFIETPKGISDDEYALIARNEDSVAGEIARMKENEIYQSNSAAKMHALEADRGEMKLDYDEAVSHTDFAKKICILLMVIFAASFTIFFAAGRGSGAGSQIAGLFLIVFALLAMLLFTWQASSIRRRRSLLRDLNSTITALNVTKMEYANVTRAINVTAEKYGVHSAKELEYLYNSFEDFNYRRERFVKDDEDLTYWNEYLMRLLAPLRLYDTRIWLKQAAALNHEEDMIAVHKELVDKRKAVREQIRLETHQVKSDRDEIDRLMKEADFYVPEIMEIISSVDKLCGLDRLRKEEDDSILKALDAEEAQKQKASEEEKPGEPSVQENEDRHEEKGLLERHRKEEKQMKVRTRFAPSPTGRMHVGNLRTALYAYLIAKHAGGDFILRIEDTDQERYVEGAVDIIYRTLKETGLEHDEGPDNDGGCGPYVQSERVKQGIYMKYAKELIDKGEAYYCFCTPERLESLKQEVVDENGEKKTISVYDKHCLNLSKEEVEANLAAGKPYVIRQNNPRTGTTTFHDEIYGDITVDNSELDDMILIKSDGYPTYNFANVVDDHLMGITHVVRGNEYLSSSPKYNRLYEAFGWEIPKYIHCPLITNEEHQKLSKRSGHSSFEDLVEQGYLTDAIVNFVALLGWSPEDNQEIMNLPELIEKFDYHHINKSPAVFDTTKLRWMNGEYIKKMDPEAFFRKALPYIEETVKRDCDRRKIADLVQSRIEIFPDIAQLVDFFEAVPEYDNSLYVNKKNKCTEENSLALLKEVLPVLSSQDDYSNDALFETLKVFATEKGYKVGFVMWPLRTALSGKATTPGGATQIMEILGKDESLRRIAAGIEHLER